MRLLALLLILACGTSWAAPDPAPTSAVPARLTAPRALPAVTVRRHAVAHDVIGSGTEGAYTGSTPATRYGVASMPATVRGVASWYPASGRIAAAGPALRRFLGHDWRGSLVRVCAEACVTVRVSDFCRCPRRLVDLSDDAFRRLAPLSAGVVSVRIMAAVALPETDAP